MRCLHGMWTEGVFFDGVVGRVGLWFVCSLFVHCSCGVPSRSWSRSLHLWGSVRTWLLLWVFGSSYLGRENEREGFSWLLPGISVAFAL